MFCWQDKNSTITTQGKAVVSLGGHISELRDLFIFKNLIALIGHIAIYKHIFLFYFIFFLISFLFVLLYLVIYLIIMTNVYKHHRIKRLIIILIIISKSHITTLPELWGNIRNIFMLPLKLFTVTIKPISKGWVTILN